MNYKEGEKAIGFNATRARENNTIGCKLKEARKAKGWTLIELNKELARYGLETTHKSISRWETGAAIPNAYQLTALCCCLDIDDSVLYFSENDVLNATGRKKVTEYKKDLIASGKYKPEEKLAEIIYISMPVSTLGASAGTGNFLDDENFEMMDFPRSLVPEGARFGIKIVGDSMEPVYNNGQLVWIKPTEEVKPGDIGLFVLDGNGYVKMYGEQVPDNPEDYTDSTGVMHLQPMLISINKKYSPITVSRGRYLKVVGKVL